MNVLRWGTNMIEGTSPAGLILAGAALAIASPPVRRGLRGAAVMATRGVLMAAGTVQGAMASMRGNMDEFMEEARKPMKLDADESAPDRGGMIRSVRRRGRRLAVGAAAGAVAVRHELRSIMEEAKQRHQEAVEDNRQVHADADIEPEPSTHSLTQAIEADGLEDSETDMDQKSPGKRRLRTKPL